MTDTAAVSIRAERSRTEFTIAFGLLAVVTFFLATGGTAFLNMKTLNRETELVTHTHAVILDINKLVSYMKDAETGQRGFVMTGKDSYLQPYTEARANIDAALERIRQMTIDNSEQQQRLPTLKAHIDAKLAELAETIDLRRNQGFDTAIAMVLTDRGKKEMDLFRDEAMQMQKTENDLRQQRLEERTRAYRNAVLSGIFSGGLGIVLAIAGAYFIRRAALEREKQVWLQTGQVGLANAVFGEQSTEALGSSILAFLANYFDAHAGVFFVRAGNGYRRVAMHGVPTDSNMPTQFKPGDGLLGQAVKDRRITVVNDVPDGYVTMGSALVKGNPRHLMIAPMGTEGQIQAVIELGFIHPVKPLSTELLERIADSVGIAIKSANYRTDLQNLLEETQRQAEELQAQGEELRVNNEELEEQSRALKESQTHLEQQQAELEQTNAQLEEQAQILENQRDDIARAKASVQVKAQELEQASKYKSDFLANMSHELRTPLNSSLILAKLLADNPKKNLSDEQVKFAQTIQSSGNDLLALINDILDLSKIEAGHMEVQPERVLVTRIVKDLEPVFQPLAKQKGLTFEIRVQPGCVEAIETDRQRIEQVLRNLLSNAIKFTQKGSITLTISSTLERQIAFAVTDTGIGIPEEQQRAIFDAFRQADGTISRKYGGTGLGLSISRELTRLLGGAIDLKSTHEMGSTFVVTLPEQFDPSAMNARTTSANTFAAEEVLQAPTKMKDAKKKAPAAALVAAPLPGSYGFEDDREKLIANGRTILVVEDDVSFAKILYQLAHELDFQCIVAGTAEEALIMTRQYLPSAVVLDVGLPDHSGLSVLDRMKRDPQTRHIPVHVVSANDYAQTAMALGAIGYMMKPVKRDELVDALKKLETKLDQHMRRVLIVEDDKVQRESMARLLGSHDVETVAVGTAAECLDLLKESTYDCMVLDLSLPDATGYTLLETLSSEDTYAFPPVIVYTGRDLSLADEERLRKYSKSIIIKGAKSPERLLDEVTLFLHQVVAELPAEQQRMLEQARNRDAVLEGRRILVVEDDVRNVYAITSIFEPLGAIVSIARNGKEALTALELGKADAGKTPDLVLMDVMMPEMDGLTATRLIRKNASWKKLPIIMLTAKAMKDDQERCLDAGANDYMAKPLDVEKLLSLVRVWMPR